MFNFDQFIAGLEDRTRVHERQIQLFEEKKMQVYHGNAAIPREESIAEARRFIAKDAELIAALKKLRDEVEP